MLSTAHFPLDNPFASSRFDTKWPLMEWGWCAFGLLMVVITCVLGGSPVAMLAISVLFTLGIGYIFASTHARRQAQWSRLKEQSADEIDRVQRRFNDLLQEARQTTTAVSLLRDGVVMLSSSSEIMLINPAARHLLSLGPEQNLIGRSLAEVIRIPELNQAIAASLGGDGTQKLLVEIPVQQGIRPVRARVDRFSTGDAYSLLMGLRDDTESQRVEDMRREFVANISHELKTPLAAIKGYAETVELAIKDDPDAAFHFMQQIHKQCLRLEKLISDMMQLARAQSGLSKLKLAPVCLADVVQESLKSYEPIAKAKQIELIVTSCHDQPKVLADAEATLTIVSNLIGNGIQYTPAGGEVHVQCRDAGKFVALVVEDTGVGIPEAEQSRVFERFYRVEKSRGTGVGGTGIGLSIVKNLTMALGGEVRVRSKAGKGARFEVLLPICNESSSTV